MGDQRRTDATRSGEERHWHATDIESVMSTLETSPRGLPDAEVARRLASHGRNEIPSAPARHPLLTLPRPVQQRPDLFPARRRGRCAALLGHWRRRGGDPRGGPDQRADRLRPGGQGRDRRSTPSAQMIAPHATRAARRPAPAASRWPTWCRATSCCWRPATGCRPISACCTRAACVIDESVLTGESVRGGEGTRRRCRADAALGDRTSMAFSGTLVAAGQGDGVVVATGAATEIGRISTLLGAVEPLHHAAAAADRPFRRALITWIALGVAALSSPSPCWRAATPGASAHGGGRAGGRRRSRKACRR